MAQLPASLLEILRCPITGSGLVPDGDVLRSASPGPDGPVTYPIDEGIPLLLRAASAAAGS